MDIKGFSRCQCGGDVACTVTSPIGPMVIRACPNGVHFVGQGNVTLTEDFLNPSTEVSIVDSVKIRFMLKGPNEMMHIQNCITWLKDYFRVSCGRVTVPFPQLCLANASKGSFMEKVWLTLAKNVNAGDTMSYKDLAKESGKPLAARAVGSAMRHNPFQILIPCHRVIRKDASLGDYCGGKQNATKKWLLTHEQGFHKKCYILQ